MIIPPSSNKPVDANADDAEPIEVTVAAMQLASTQLCSDTMAHFAWADDGGVHHE